MTGTLTETALTVFGGTGDLTFRKLLPSLYSLSVQGQLTAGMKIILIGRREYTAEEYRKKAETWIQKNTRFPITRPEMDELFSRITYFRMDFIEDEGYLSLRKLYQQLMIRHHFFYFAVAPRYFKHIAVNLSLIIEKGTGSVILEKPFGEDLDSACQLNHIMEASFLPENIFRIDHYLGKEMVRNLQVIRFMNPVFSETWNHRFIERVDITAFEEAGIETRGGYYDTSGALKDMVQNHLFQILTLTAMEQPEEFSGESIQECQQEVLRALRPVSKLDIKAAMVLGQYEGYRSESLVNPQSDTETFAALKLYIDNPRWQDIPFYIQTGKMTGERSMEITLTFKRGSHEAEPNRLVIKIQPEERVMFEFNIKKPGNTEETAVTRMDFCQSCIEDNRINTPEAYERLLLACFRHEHGWFSSWQQIESSWDYTAKLLAAYQAQNNPVYLYPQGQKGPAAIKNLEL